MTAILLPFPPSVNSIWRHNRKTGKVYLADRYKTWKRAADNEYHQHKRDWQPIKGAFRAAITLDLAHQGRSDIDNRIKAVLDWLQRSELIENDKLCMGLTVKWGKANGGCKVVLTSIPVKKAA